MFIPVTFAATEDSRDSRPSRENQGKTWATHDDPESSSLPSNE